MTIDGVSIMFVMVQNNEVSPIVNNNYCTKHLLDQFLGNILNLRLSVKKFTVNFKHLV